MPAEAVHVPRALHRALNQLRPLLGDAKAEERIERTERARDPGPVGALERVGLVRQLRSDIDDAVDVVQPNWNTVRTLHRAWVQAVIWERQARHG